MLAWKLIPFIHPRSWSTLILSSVILVFGTVVAGLTAAFLPYRRAIYWAGVAPILISCAWIAPVLIFLHQGSLWAIPTGIFFASVWIRVAARHATPPRSILIPVAAAVCLQLGFGAISVNYRFLGAALVTLGIALIAWCASAELKRWNTTRVLTAVAFSILLTALGFVRYLPFGSGSGGSAVDTQAETDSGQGRLNASAVYHGIVLWTEEPHHVALTAPKPRQLTDQPLRLNQRDPMTIPFYGVYWIFKPPDREPPPNAVTIRADPVEKAFRSNNAAPLMMEAHQNLGMLITLACCSRIDMQIRNADRYANLLSIELVLRNTSLASKPHLSLGTAHVQPLVGMQGAAAETLIFPIPTPSTEFKEFDELTIRFPRQPVHATYSARVAIERFILIPR